MVYFIANIHIITEYVIDVVIKYKWLTRDGMFMGSMFYESGDKLIFSGFYLKEIAPGGYGR